MSSEQIGGNEIISPPPSSMRVISPISSHDGSLSHSMENPPEMDIESMWTTVLSAVPLDDHWNLAATPTSRVPPSSGSACPIGIEIKNSPASISSVWARKSPTANLILLDSSESPDKPPEIHPVTVRWGSLMSTLAPWMQPSCNSIRKFCPWSGCSICSPEWIGTYSSPITSDETIIVKLPVPETCILPSCWSGGGLT